MQNVTLCHYRQNASKLLLQVSENPQTWLRDVFIYRTELNQTPTAATNFYMIIPDTIGLCTAQLNCICNFSGG